MWKYTERNAYSSISLHDCKSDSITIYGNNLIVEFPDGFWITPASSHSDHDKPVKTGPAQLCICGVYAEEPFDAIDIYKTIRLFGKKLLCYKHQPQYTDFLKMFQCGKYELEFITEYHSSASSLYQCWIYKKNSGIDSECQLEITAECIEYRWNEILYKREW